MFFLKNLNSLSAQNVNEMNKHGSPTVHIAIHK